MGEKISKIASDFLSDRESWAGGGQGGFVRVQGVSSATPNLLGEGARHHRHPRERQEERTQKRDKVRIGISQHEVWDVCLTSPGNQNCSTSTQRRENYFLSHVPTCQEGGTGPTFSFGTRGGGKRSKQD